MRGKPHDIRDRTFYKGGTDHQPSEAEFVMLRAKRTLEIWNAIRELPGDQRPGNVRHMFDLCLAYLDWNTGQIMLSRDEFAEMMGISTRRVTEASAVLERLGAIERRPMMRGKRRTPWVEYHIVSDVAWKGELRARRRAAQASNVIPLPAA